MTIVIDTKTIIIRFQGLQVCDSQRVSAWELLEGHKNPAPLSWAWFRAVKIERKPLTYQSAHKLLRYHTHSQLRSANHYLDPPPLPPEDLEPEKKEIEPGKADTPMSVDSPSRGPVGSVGSTATTTTTGGKGKAMKPRRHRRNKGAATPTAPLPQQIPVNKNKIPLLSNNALWFRAGQYFNYSKNWLTVQKYCFTI